MQADLLKWLESYKPDLIRCGLQASDKNVESKEIKRGIANSLENEIGLSRRVIAYFSNPYQKHLADRLTAEIEKVNDIGSFDARQKNITIYYLPTILEINSALDDCLAAIPCQQAKSLTGHSGGTTGDTTQVTPEINENKSVKEKQEGILEPKPPEILQKILWVLKYGRRYWWLILLAIFILLISSGFIFKIFTLPKFNLPSKEHQNIESKTSGDSSPAINNVAGPNSHITNVVNYVSPPENKTIKERQEANTPADYKKTSPSNQSKIIDPNRNSP